MGSRLFTPCRLSILLDCNQHPIHVEKEIYYREFSSAEFCNLIEGKQKNYLKFIFSWTGDDYLLVVDSICIILKYRKSGNVRG